MIAVRLPFDVYEGDSNLRMPRCCIVCGEGECRRKEAILSVPYTGDRRNTMGPTMQEVRLNLPLCDAHWGHFEAHTRMIAFGALLLFFLFLTAVACGFFRLFWPAGILGILMLPVMIYLLFRHLSMGQVTIHGSVLTNTELVLEKVHPEFAAELVEGNTNACVVDLGDYRDEEGRFDRHTDPDGDHRRGESRNNQIIGIGFAMVGIFGFVAMLCVFGLVAVLANLTTSPPKPPDWFGKLPDGPPMEQPQERPVEPAYLSDLPEHDVIVGFGQLGKNGLMGFPFERTPQEGHAIRVKGMTCQKGIAMHAAAPHARARYRLGGQYNWLTGAAAMADLPPSTKMTGAPTPVTFSVWGDGMELWSSRPLQQNGERQEFRIAVAGVQVLELRCASNRGHFTWSVWLDPIVTR